jgi:thiol-disulfide isomerase/thioredoxin
MRLRAVVVMLLAGGLLAVAGCAGGDGIPRAAGPAAGTGSAAPAPAGPETGNAAAGAARPGAPAATPAGPAAVPEVLKFSGRTVDGGRFDAASLGGRPVVLWFWAPWCATCAGQAPSIRDMAAAHGDRVGILGVAGLGDERAMREFVAEFRLEQVAQLNDRAGVVWRKFDVTEQSTFVFLDASGKVIHRGWLDSLDFEARVARLAGR